LPFTTRHLLPPNSSSPVYTPAPGASASIIAAIRPQVNGGNPHPEGKDFLHRIGLPSIFRAAAAQRNVRPGYSPPHAIHRLVVARSAQSQRGWRRPAPGADPAGKYWANRFREWLLPVSRRQKSTDLGPASRSRGNCAALGAASNGARQARATFRWYRYSARYSTLSRILADDGG
jgi:hypothetical protein